MNAERILGVLFGAGLGALKPRRRTARRRAPVPQAGRALATLAGLAATALAEALARPDPVAPEPTPRGARRRPAGSPEPAGHRTDALGHGALGRTRPRDPAADGVLILRAMIAAARADGALDHEEARAISEALDRAGLDGAERDLVLADLDRPLDLDTLARGLDDPLVAAQAYAACLIAIGVASEPEAAFLADLARRTRLDARATAAIEARVGAG